MIHEIRGARAAIDDPEAVLRNAAAWAAGHGVEVLLADARAVVGRDHIESAVRHGERAKDQRAMATHTLAMESLLYLSGRRQIADAISVAGIRKGTTGVAVVVFGDTLAADFLEAMGWSADPTLLDAARKDLEVLGIREPERATVPRGKGADLALERVALVDLEK